MAKREEVKAVEFVAEIRQVKTMADHTVNVTLNLPEYCVQQAAWFMQHTGDVVKSVSQLENLIKLDGKDSDQAEKKAKRSGNRLDSRRIRDRRDQRESGEV